MHSFFSCSVNGDFTFYSNAYHTAQELQWNGLYTMDEAGEDLKCISIADENTGRYSHCSPKWSPDGEKIAYLSIENDENFSTQQIILVEKDGTNE